MCNALWECIKCPAKVVCCCCKCALNMFLGVFCGIIVLLVVIGVILYFTVFKDSGKSDEAKMQQMQMVITEAPKAFRDYFQKIQ